MTEFSDLLRQGSTQAWFFLPTAVLLGALHGLEPGHSKTLMAAFIVAVRGTVGQAILLGLSAALAAAALRFGSQWNAETTEPYFQIGSAVIIAGLALWMLYRTRRDLRAEAEHGHYHDHAGHEQDAAHSHGEYQDDHERAHAQEIEQRFANRSVTTGQIVLFGLTGGLLPCPAAFSILVLCLQLKKFTLGFSLVLAFSVGLALTLVASGAVAAWGMRHAQKRMLGFGRLARRLPYFSVAFLLLVAMYIGYTGWRALP
jgi:nickel/cobalt transporter (NicO) family protein